MSKELSILKYEATRSDGVLFDVGVMKNNWDVFTSEGEGLRLIGTFITSEGEGLNNQYESMKLREAKVT